VKLLDSSQRLGQSEKAASVTKDLFPHLTNTPKRKGVSTTGFNCLATTHQATVPRNTSTSKTI
jgi:hypothetical protein